MEADWTTLDKTWIIPPAESGRHDAATRWRIPPLLAQILHNRGLNLDDNPAPFLAPKLMDLIPPGDLPGATEAAEVVAKAIGDKQKIVLYGDYDVDGITGVAILWHLLKIAGADVSFYVPHRLEEGYGVNCNALKTLIDEGADVVITIDCGITATEAATLARDKGATLIITDHHTPPDPLPDTFIVHPTALRPSSNPDLCGAGVAFKFAWAIALSLSSGDRVDEKYRQYLQDALALAALGTVADVVPLTGENRVITRFGLSHIAHTPFVGLQALLESAGLAKMRLDSFDVGFKIGPRLNAAGRMGHARLAVELLTRADESRAREIALYLEEQNRARQSTERRITRQALDFVRENRLDSDAHRGIVVAQEGWHAGVIGIVAARIVDAFYRPAVVISLTDGKGQGSARSINNFNIVDAFTQCDAHLNTYGGHAMAAGLKIDSENVPAFAEQFNEIANNTLTAKDLTPALRIDAEVDLQELDLPTVETIVNLGPFGAGNPKPRLATDWLELVDEPRTVGKTGSHLSASFRNNGAVLKAIAFGQSDHLEPLKKHRRCKIAFEPIINDFNGRRSVEMQVKDFIFPDA